ncbi:unnamed protein product [Colias eurytheme]|nr:unnamed protein product [Colias eurytheme]
MRYIFIWTLLWAVYEAESQLSTKPYSSLFSETGYPYLGDIPLLNRKVFRGSRVTIREHPYIVSVRRNFVHYLTGSLLTKNVVLSVAHPLYRVPIDELAVVSGENYSDRGTIVLTVVLLIIHKQFDPYTLRADLALIRFYEDIVVRSKLSIDSRSSTKTIELVSPTTAIFGTRAFVTGWGRCDFTGKELCLPRSSLYRPDERSDPMLRTISFVITERNVHCDVYNQHSNPLVPGQLCTGVAREMDVLTPCMAVPGAPLVVWGKLAGVLSWGLGCGYANDLPLIYSDVQYYGS